MPRISVPARLEHLDTINSFISRALQGQGGSLLRNVELVMEELLVNVFSYAYPDKDGTAEVSFRVVHFDGKEHFCFSIADWGKPFNPFTEAAHPDTSLEIDERPVGGLGVHLVKSIADHYAYCREENTNHLELYFAKA